jgi:hypothetical protein
MFPTSTRARRRKRYEPDRYFQPQSWASLCPLEECTALSTERSYFSRISTGLPYRRPQDGPPLTILTQLGIQTPGLEGWTYFDKPAQST